MELIRVIAWLVGALVVPAPAQEPRGNPIASEILGAHNAVRARAGVPPLTWSKRLESAARQWAESLLAKGTFRHRPQSNFGENLFEIRGARADATRVVRSWAAEADDFNLATNSCRGDAVCGHYTQLVWRDTRQLGCAVARGGRREVWVCNYSPPGNVIGERPY